MYTIGWYPWQVLRASVRGSVLKMGQRDGYTGGILFSSLRALALYLSKDGRRAKCAVQILEVHCRPKDSYTALDGRLYLANDRPMRWRPDLKSNVKKLVHK